MRLLTEKSQVGSLARHESGERRIERDLKPRSLFPVRMNDKSFWSRADIVEWIAGYEG